MTATNISNSLAPRQPTISQYLAGPAVKDTIMRVVGSNRAAHFMASVVSAVAVNPTLAQCTHKSILNCALLCEALKLSPSPQIGQFYLVPYKVDGVYTATPQIGYKGLIQLAMRTGQYKRLTAVEIKDGELVDYDFLRDEIRARMIADPAKREAAKSIGYYAELELVNGFRKALYWTRERVENHAKRFSQAFSKSGSPWQKHFDEMALKTVLRNLLMHWGPMTAEMETAFTTESETSAPEVSSEGEFFTPAAPVPAAIETQPEIPEPVSEPDANPAHGALFGDAQ